jgi:RHS repeat-associated protein
MVLALADGAAAGVTYGNDGDGKRVKKSNGELYWYGTGPDPLLETDLSGNNPTEYVFFNGKRIARRDPSGTVYYYFEDHLGSSRVIVQAGQNTACYEADFYPFGGERVVTNTCGQNYKFAGMERDSETGNDQTWFRYYASNLGRWLSPDPVAGDITNPQSLNRYAYVLNNPCSLVDPLGLCPPGTHKVNLAPAALAIVAMGIKQYGGPFLQGDANGKIISMDCTGFLSWAVAMAVPAAYKEYGRGAVKNGTGPFYPVPNPQVGEVILFETPGHVGVVTSTNPFKFAGSQTSTGPAVVDFSSDTWWPKHMSGATYYEYCVPDKPTGGSRNGGSRGGGGRGVLMYEVAIPGGGWGSIMGLGGWTGSWEGSAGGGLTPSVTSTITPCLSVACPEGPEG